MGNLASSGTPRVSSSFLTDPSRSRHPHQARPQHAHTEGELGGGETPFGVALAAPCEVAQVVCPLDRCLVTVTRHEDAPPASRSSRSTTVARPSHTPPRASCRPRTGTCGRKQPRGRASRRRRPPRPSPHGSCPSLRATRASPQRPPRHPSVRRVWLRPSL